jgi:hypothetical protein
MVEECDVLVGTLVDGVWLVSRQGQSTGCAASVEADWAWALDREETCGDVMGFWHTHPVGAGVWPSEHDSRTMHAWCSALGKPLLCLIAEGDEIGGQVFEDDKAEGQPVSAIELLAPGQWRVQ